MRDSSCCRSARSRSLSATARATCHLIVI